MPTSTFYNLPDEKKQRLLQAVEREFTRVPFEQTSINRIVQDAGISRGSFYQYFEDKDDLFHYCIQGFILGIRDEAVAAIERRKGNVFEVAEDLLAYLLHLQQSTNRVLLEHMMMQMHNSTDERMQFSTCLEDYQQEREIFFKQIDTSSLNLQTPEDLGYIFDILINELRSAMFAAHLTQRIPEQILQEFHHKMNLLRRGLARQTEETR